MKLIEQAKFMLLVSLLREIMREQIYVMPCIV